MEKVLKNTFSPSSLRSETEVVFGTLNPIAWSKSGSVEKFSIYSTDEEDIIIEEFKDKRKLRSLLNKKVEAKGRLRSNQLGEKVIKLKEIKKLNDPSAPAMCPKQVLSNGLWNEEFTVSIPKDYAFAQYQNLQGEFFEAS